MRRANVLWCETRVAERFAEAAITARRLPPIRVQGYFNSWPPIARQHWESLGAEPPLRRVLPPTPSAIERMLEAMQWVQWLSIEQRHLVWMRAKGYGWRAISARFGCDRSTAWRRWQQALTTIVRELNRSSRLRVSARTEASVGKCACVSGKNVKNTLQHFSKI